MRWIRFALLVSVLMLLTVRYPPRLASLGLMPLWMFLPVLLYGLSARTGPAILLAWFSGLAVDLVSLEPLGWHAFLFAAAAFLLVRIRAHLFASHPGTQALLAATFTLTLSVVMLARLNLAEPDLSVPGRILPAVLLSMMTGAVFPLLSRIDARIGLTQGFREGERRV